MPNYNLIKDSVQYKFHASRAKIQVFGGGFGNGKTTALAVKALKIAISYPGVNGLLARSTFPKLNDTLRKVVLTWCPDHWVKRKPTKDENSLYLTNGSVINFRYIAQRGKSTEDGQTTSNLLSAEYGFVGVDQVEDPEIVHKDFLDLLGRLRGSDAYRPPRGEEDDTMPTTGPRWLMLTCNPTHNWVFKDIVQPYLIWRDKGIKTPNLLVDEETGLPIMELFEGPTHMNAANLPPDYIKAQEATLKGQMRERFLLGKWAAFEGLVYGTFSDDRNRISREAALGYLRSCLERHVKIRVIEGYDFGMVSPSCYLFGFVDDHGRVFVIDGFYQSDFDLTEQPGAIKKIRSDYEPMLRVTEPIIADPAIFKREVDRGRQTNTTIAKLFGEAGIKMVAGANDITGGLAKVNSYINGGINHPHVVTGELPGPLLYVADEVEFFFDEIYSYYWKRNPQGRFIDEPVDNNDHAMDTIKYMLSKLPKASDILIPKDKLPPQWLRWHELEERV